MPESGNCVSFRAAMSTFSLLNSLLMTAVFLKSLMLLLSTLDPGRNVRTFQQPNLRAGLLSFLWFGGAQFIDLPSGWLVLIPKHPVRIAKRGRTTPYWLKAAQLKVGGSCPNEVKKPLPPTEGAPGATLYAD